MLNSTQQKLLNEYLEYWEPFAKFAESGVNNWPVKDEVFKTLNIHKWSNRHKKLLNILINNWRSVKFPLCNNGYISLYRRGNNKFSIFLSHEYSGDLFKELKYQESELMGVIIRSLLLFIIKVPFKTIESDFLKGVPVSWFTDPSSSYSLFITKNYRDEDNQDTNRLLISLF